MKWIITRDYLAEEYDDMRSEVGVRGQNTPFYTKAGELPLRFKIFDDDGEIYYEGRSDEEEFEPLDWAMYNAGATAIHYRQKDGSWPPL